MKTSPLLPLLFTIAATLAWTTESGADAGDEIAVVVNTANPAQAVTRDELRPVFQTTKTQWPDGVHAEPTNLADDNELRKRFDQAVLGLDPDRVARFWVDRKIRGGERPPRKVATSSAVLRSVATDRGGVGYIPAHEVNNTVKVVARIKNGQLVGP